MDSRTYCPLCGAMDLPTAEIDGAVVAYCGESPATAHTKFTVAVSKQPKKQPPAKPEGMEVLDGR